MHSFGCPKSRQQREQRVFGSGPNSIDPADRQDLRCGERIVNTDDSRDLTALPMISVGRIAEYREAARAEHGNQTRDELLDTIAHLFKRCDQLTNDRTRWKQAYARLDAASHHLSPLFRRNDGT
jgi:hypothetical protein